MTDLKCQVIDWHIDKEWNRIVKEGWDRPYEFDDSYSVSQMKGYTEETREKIRSLLYKYFTRQAGDALYPTCNLSSWAVPGEWEVELRDGYRHLSLTFTEDGTLHHVHEELKLDIASEFFMYPNDELLGELATRLSNGHGGLGPEEFKKKELDVLLMWYQFSRDHYEKGVPYVGNGYTRPVSRAELHADLDEYLDKTEAFYDKWREFSEEETQKKNADHF